MRSPRTSPSALGTLAALALAYAHFGRTFLGPRERFWRRMTTTGLTLGALALAAGEAERLRPRKRDVALGIAIAAGLVAVFQLGDRAARRVMPRGDEEIGDIYALRSQGTAPEIALRLGGVIGPAEELFWRGWLQRRVGWLAASGAYAGAHLVTRNATLVGAAGVAGIYWGALAALGTPMSALIVSHVVWDVWIFLVQPTQPE
ncbi:MAG: CPBP family intramembrane metalloprotease [Chloroflexota bacterium]|nr:CPBP family intramembrane metalloprotease [Chloroflexota bacterium]